MAKWKKNESLARAVGREAGSIVNGVAKELLSIATLGLLRPARGQQKFKFRYPKFKGSKRR